jgi:hypothetical protein
MRSSKFTAKRIRTWLSAVGCGAFVAGAFALSSAQTVDAQPKGKNPPGPAGGPGTGNPPGPAGGPGKGPNPPGPAGGPNVPNPPGPAGGPGKGPNPPGPAGGPNVPNPPGPVGGPGRGPNPPGPVGGPNVGRPIIIRYQTRVLTAGLVVPAVPAAGRTALQVTAVNHDPAPGGLVVGDVILAVNGSWVTSEAEYAAALKKPKGANEILVYRAAGNKVETTKATLVKGGLGVTVKVVTIDLQEG